MTIGCGCAGKKLESSQWAFDIAWPRVQRNQGESLHCLVLFCMHWCHFEYVMLGWSVYKNAAVCRLIPNEATKLVVPVWTAHCYVEPRVSCDNVWSWNFGALTGCDVVDLSFLPGYGCFCAGPGIESEWRSSRFNFKSHEQLSYEIWPGLPTFLFSSSCWESRGQDVRIMEEVNLCRSKNYTMGFSLCLLFHVSDSV